MSEPLPPIEAYDDADGLNQPESAKLPPADEYLKRKGIALQALQYACTSTVELCQDKIGSHTGLILFRELVDVDGNRAGYERILGERISMDGGSKPNDKYATKGATVRETFTPIGFNTDDLGVIRDRIIVCAGLADGYRIHEATGEPVACGVGENNVASIADSINDRHKGEILVAVDNDEAGHRAGTKSGFPWTHPEQHKDWSDLYQAEGSNAVKDQVNSPIAPEAEDTADTVNPFNLENARVVDLLETDPPERKWLVSERLPLNVVGILAAAGGTGKSMATLQLAVSVATGLPWLNMSVEEEGEVVMFSAEDDRDEIHRRLQHVKQHYQQQVGAEDLDAFSDHIAALAKRLFILDRVGADNRMTVKANGQTERTTFAAHVIEAVKHLTDCRLVVLDPLSRFDGGEPNDNSDGTRLIEAAEYIRRHTGATVLLPHHVSKAGIRDSSAGQEAVRGASGLVDGARWVGVLSGLKADEAKDYGVNEDDAGRYVRFTTPKANYSAPWEGMWLERQVGGVLVPSELKPAQEGRKERKAEAEYQRIVSGIRDLITKHGPMVKRHIADNYGGTKNALKASHQKVRNAITRAVEEGELIGRTRADKSGEVIEVPGPKLVDECA